MSEPFKYIGIITKTSIQCVKKSIILLKWDSPHIRAIIVEKICPKCNSKLYFADTWYNDVQIAVFKRMCPTCRRIYFLTGFFKSYTMARKYFIDLFTRYALKNDKYGKRRKF